MNPSPFPGGSREPTGQSKTLTTGSVKERTVSFLITGLHSTYQGFLYKGPHLSDRTRSTRPPRFPPPSYPRVHTPSPSLTCAHPISLHTGPSYRVRSRFKKELPGLDSNITLSSVSVVNSAIYTDKRLFVKKFCPTTGERYRVTRLGLNDGCPHRQVRLVPPVSRHY